MWFTERIPFYTLALITMNDSSQKLREKTMLLTDNEHLHGHENHPDMCSSWQEKCVNSSGMHVKQMVRKTDEKLFRFIDRQMVFFLKWKILKFCKQLQVYLYESIKDPEEAPRNFEQWSSQNISNQKYGNLVTITHIHEHIYISHGRCTIRYHKPLTASHCSYQFSQYHLVLSVSMCKYGKDIALM